jgi:ribosomal 50S subunit-recycling heat shock protein
VIGMTNLALIVLLFLQLPASSSVQAGVLTGQIQSPDGRSVGGIQVYAVQEGSGVSTKEDGLIAGVAQTDKAGRFQMKDLPAGAYYIAAGPLEAPTYYPGVTKLTAARPLKVSGDTNVPTFTLDPFTVDVLVEHTEVPPEVGAIPSSGKPLAPTTELKVHQVLQVEWGKTWWAARIMELFPDGRVKIHYLGWDSSSDEIVTRSRLQLDDDVIEKTKALARTSMPLAVIDTIQLVPPGFSPSSIGGFVIIDAIDIPSDPPEKTEKGDVPADAGPISSTGLKVDADTKLELNQVLQVEWGRTFWAARVLELLSDGRVKIHYLGWVASWDEVVPRSRLQLDDKAIEKTQEASKPSRDDDPIFLDDDAIFDFSLEPEKTEKGEVPAFSGPIKPTGVKVDANTKLEVNQVLDAHDGGDWFAARILALLPDGSVKVHYIGWPTSDEVVPRSRLQLDDKAIEKTIEAAKLAEVEEARFFEETIEAARLLELDSGFDLSVLPGFLDAPAAEKTEKGDVPGFSGPIKPTGVKVDANTKLEVNQVLDAHDGGDWFAARILELLPDGSVKVHYIGWPTSDEVVPRSRLQLDDKAIEKTIEAAKLSAFDSPVLEDISPKPEKTEKGEVPAHAQPISSTGVTVSEKTRLEVNQVLQVESFLSYWAVRILELLPDGRVQIHYLG